MYARQILSCWLAATLCAIASPLLRAADPPAGETIDRHLQAGEFAPALNLARNAPAEQRDQLLVKVARAQADVGMRRAAIATAADISSDVSRGSMLGSLSSAPIGGQPPGRAGGGPEPDFEALIDLITTTVAPSSWSDAGGPGNIREFEGGVRVDATGKIHSLLKTDNSGKLARIRRNHLAASVDADVRNKSLLRKVSLTRLERVVQLRLAAGLPLDEEMHVLAGLNKIQYVLVYPETGDLVLAGPAGDWRTDEEQRLISVDSGRPVLQLDDLVVLLRRTKEQPGKPFGCSITPLQENLARTKAFLDANNGKPIARPQKWLQELQASMGDQTVDYYGIDPRTRIAKVLFEADYRMKLVGIGLEPGTVNVPSFLSQIQVAKGEAPPPLGVLRWWFTLNYDAVMTTPQRDGFELRGQGVKVLSENEMLTERGERVHTGQSDALTAGFAQRFTEQFPALAAKYPIYAELQNVFDLALVAALIETEDLPSQVDWHLTCFADAEQYPVQFSHAPKTVASVVNSRNVNRTTFVSAVSGGVRVDPHSLVGRKNVAVDEGGKLSSRRDLFAPSNLPRDKWWWD